MSDYINLQVGQFIVRMQVMFGTEEGNQVVDFVGNALVNDPRGYAARESLEILAKKVFEKAGVTLYQPGLFQTHCPES